MFQNKFMIIQTRKDILHPINHIIHHFDTRLYNLQSLMKTSTYILLVNTESKMKNIGTNDLI